MDEIKQIEEQAQDIKRQAMESQTDLKSRSGERILYPAQFNRRSRKKQFIKQAEKEAEKEIEELNRKTDMECQKIRQFARSRMDDAISLVMGKVVKTHGHN